MSEFKYQFVNFLLLVLLGVGVYWAFTTIDNGIVYNSNTIVSNDKIINKNGDEKIEEEIVLFDNTKIKEEEIDEEKNVNFEVEQSENKYVELILKIEKLKNNGSIFSSGNTGESVGVIQEFLNIYNGDTLKIDKDYGPTTKKRVINFQKAELGGGDGRVGPNTFKAILRWLNKQ